MAGFGFGGGSSRATTVSVKPEVLWDPSQKGLFMEWPQRQSDMVVRPAKPKSAPCGSTISKSPSTRIEPLLFIVILVAAIFYSWTREKKSLFQPTQLTQKNPADQYFGTDGSTWSDQARMPPFRLRILRKPALRKKSTASAERLPLRQCATISREESSSCTRRGNSPSGINRPLRLQI